MADVTISSAVSDGSTVTITGSGFTRTTTTIFVDGGEVPFTWLSETEVSIADENGTEVHAEKAGVITDPVSIEEAAMTIDETTEERPAGGTLGASGQPAVPITADDVKTEQEKGPPDPAAPAQEPPGSVEPVTVGTKEPYPQGNPPDPEDQFYAAHGFRRAKE
jgi:hypothetical protein